MNRSDFLIGVAAAGAQPAVSVDEFQAIERATGGRLGVYALDQHTGRTLTYRAADRFPFASTCKLPLVIATFARIDRRVERLDRPVRIEPPDMLAESAFVKPNPRGVTLTVEALCAAAMIHSDNTAANALLRALGGPARLTAFVGSTGIGPFRLDRAEPALNEARPHDRRDTSTPAAMADLLRRFASGSLVRPASTKQILAWMRGNLTGGARLRAGVPAGWTVADKTGTTAVGADDLGLLYPPAGGPPLVVAAYQTGCTAPPARREAALAEVARIVTRAF